MREGGYVVDEREKGAAQRATGHVRCRRFPPLVAASLARGAAPAIRGRCCCASHTHRNRNRIAAPANHAESRAPPLRAASLKPLLGAPKVDQDISHLPNTPLRRQPSTPSGPCYPQSRDTSDKMTRPSVRAQINPHTPAASASPRQQMRCVTLIPSLLNNSYSSSPVALSGHAAIICIRGPLHTPLCETHSYNLLRGGSRAPNACTA